MIRDGKGKNCKVHRLVAETFIENPKALPQVNHIDGDKSNNTVENLEWCTNTENIRHAFSTGLNKSGEKSPYAKLTENEVSEIRKEYVKGDPVYGAKPLSRKYGVTSTTIRHIVNGRKWRYAV